MLKNLLWPVYKRNTIYCGLFLTHCLMLGSSPTLQLRLASLGNLSMFSSILRFPHSSSITLNRKRSAQVRLLPAKNCPPRPSSLHSSLVRTLSAFSHSFWKAASFWSAGVNITLKHSPWMSQSASTISLACAASRLFLPPSPYSQARNLKLNEVLWTFLRVSLAIEIGGY